MKQNIFGVLLICGNLEVFVYKHRTRNVMENI